MKNSGNNWRLSPHWPYNDGTVKYEGQIYITERLRGILDALDWAFDEGVEDEPL